MLQCDRAMNDAEIIPIEKAITGRCIQLQCDRAMNDAEIPKSESSLRGGRSLQCDRAMNDAEICVQMGRRFIGIEASM